METLPQLPLEVISIIASFLDDTERLNLMTVCRSWQQMILPLIWKEPSWKTLNMATEPLLELLAKYGDLVRIVPASDNVGQERVQLLLENCPKLRNIYFYGKAELWDSIKDIIPNRSLRNLEFYMVGDFCEDTIGPLTRFNRLTDLSITYDNIAYVIKALDSLPPGQLRSLSAFQVISFSKKFLDLIQTRFPNLEKLQVQCGTIEDMTLAQLSSQPMPRLKRLEVDVLVFKRTQPCFNLSATNFPLLEQLLIDLHGTKSTGLNCILSGKWNNLKELSLFRVNTENPVLLNNDTFPSLQSLQLQIYQPFNQDTLINLITDFPQLSNLELNKVEMTDDDFNIPLALDFPYTSQIKNFSITNNSKPLGHHYLGFMMRHMVSLIKWTLPTLDCEPIPISEEEEVNDHDSIDLGLHELNEINEDREETEVEKFVQFLIENEYQNIMPDLKQILADASSSSIPLVHYLAQACPGLNYLFINLLDDSIEAKDLNEEFNRINPNLTVKVE